MDPSSLSPEARAALALMGQHPRKKLYYRNRGTPDRQPRSGLWFGPEVTDELEPLLLPHGGSRFTLTSAGKRLAKALAADADSN